LIKEQPVKLD